MKNIVFIFFVLFLFLKANAQNQIKGKVTDINNEPLWGATVFMPELNKGTVTNQHGEYFISNIPDGKFKIQFSYVGFNTDIETIEINQVENIIDVKITQAVLQSQEVVISGGYINSQHENAVKIDVLKLDPLKNRNSPNFTEIISTIPGIDMISKGSGVSKPVIRGLAMNDILVLNNGVRFENYQYSDHHPLGIDEFGIEDIEIIKGPASLLYGSNAIGGVINFIKEKPAPIGSINGDYNLNLYSNTLGISNNLGIKGASKKFFGGIRMGQKSNSDFLQGGGTFAPNSRFNETMAKINAGFTNSLGTFKLYYDFNHQKIGLVEDEAIEKITSRGRKNKIFYQELNTHLLSSQNKLYFNKLKLDLNTAYQNTELIHFAEAKQYEIQMKLATLTYEAKLHLPSKTNSDYVLGIQGINQINKNVNNRETILLPDATSINYSMFGLLQYKFFENLKLQTGLRYDVKNITSQAVGEQMDTINYRAPLKKSFGSFSGSIGITYSFSQDLLIRTNLASAFRTPNLAELTSKGPHELRYEIGDNKLLPEKSNETDVSIHYHINNLILDFAWFYNIVDNYIFIAPTNDTSSTGLTVYRYKQKNSALWGSETGVHFHPQNIKWLHFETTFAAVIGKQHNGNYLPFIPAHKLNFELRAEKEKLFHLTDASISVHSCTAFAQNRPAPSETATNGYSRFDLGMGGKIKISEQPIFISVTINNLFDKKYIDHLSTLKEVNFYNPGRNISLILKIPFEVKHSDNSNS